MISENDCSIKKASTILNINYSTAKYIIRTFNKTGTLETKQMIKRRIREKKR